MKKNIITLAILLLLGVAAFPSLGQAKVGAGLGFGSEVESLGIGINGEFPTANSRIIISPSFILFFPDVINFWELNGNMNYVFSRSSATVYGILGLNIARAGFDDISTPFGTVEGQSDTDLGLNIGVGVNFDIGSNVTPFAEMKYAISDFDQLVIFGGVRFPIR
ncbi:MAG: hypothetical protein AAGA66_10020 [Bacteroidota bacterium]